MVPIMREDTDRRGEDADVMDGVDGMSLNIFCLRLDWMGDTMRGILMAVPIRIRRECSRDEGLAVTAVAMAPSVLLPLSVTTTSEIVERTATRLRTMVTMGC